MKKTIARAVFAVLAFMTLSTAPVSAQHDHGTVQAKNPWARSTAPGMKNGAAYLTLMNAGKTPDRLIAAATPVAKKVELHTHIKDGDIMRMRHVVGGIAVKPGATVMLKPGGYHAMLMGLKKPLKKGERFPLSLTFEKAGTVTIEVPVAGFGAMKPGEPGGMHHGH
ncbi:MAG: copper chaperone PCu(A)C [Rhodospirillales bacterium]